MRTVVCPECYKKRDVGNKVAMVICKGCQTLMIDYEYWIKTKEWRKDGKPY